MSAKVPLQGAEPSAKEDVENKDPNVPVINPSEEKTTTEVQPEHKPKLKRKKTKKQIINQMIQKMTGVEEGAGPCVTDLDGDPEDQDNIGQDSETDISDCDSEDDDDASWSYSEKGNCVKAAIYKGFIKVGGSPDDLEMIVHSEEGECGHIINATLGDLLEQPDYAGLDYEDGLQNATVVCTEEGCDPEYEGMGRTYVTNLCNGEPYFTNGKAHNHCTECKIFGECIGDYRNSHCDECGEHYFAGCVVAFECPCQREVDPQEELLDRLIEMYLNCPNQSDSGSDESSGGEEPMCNEQ